MVLASRLLLAGKVRGHKLREQAAAHREDGLHGGLKPGGRQAAAVDRAGCPGAGKGDAVQELNLQLCRQNQHRPLPFQLVDVLLLPCQAQEPPWSECTCTRPTSQPRKLPASSDCQVSTL